jgi:type II secretory pathway component GspD/PulD (secretin)
VIRLRTAVLLCCSLLLGAGATAAGQEIAIDVQGVDVSDVIALLAAQSGRNVVTDGSVKPEKITVHLHGVTFDEALRAIASSNGLAIRREGAILVVGEATAMHRDGGVVLALRYARPDDIAKELTGALPAGAVVLADKRTRSVIVTADAATAKRARRLVAMLDAPRSAAASGPRTRSYRLRYLRPDSVTAKLKAVVAGATVLPDQEQNAVLVSGNRRMQKMAREVIAQIDVASPQVLFEVKVADVTPVNDSSNVGFEFGGLDLTGQPLAGAAAYAFTGGTIPVNVRLNMLVSKGYAQILATPRLVTVNNKEADLTIGETYPIVYSTSVLGGQNVQYVDVGVHLRLTPTIGSDGSVTAELHPDYSELVGFTTSGYPIVANRKIDSTLRVQDGSTIVLGGLMRDTSSETITKIPGLADIPIIGGFFKNKQNNHERDEIVFLITPHVIYPGAQPPVK